MTDDLSRWADNGGPAIDTPTGYVKHLLAHIGRLEERLGEALVRENNLVAALEALIKASDGHAASFIERDRARKALAERKE